MRRFVLTASSRSLTAGALLRQYMNETETTMSRILTLAYGGVAYVVSFLTLLYAIGFIGNVLVAKSLDSGATDPWLGALAVDLALLSLFGIQHSVMARHGYKRLVTSIIPASVATAGGS
jgi:methanethiol S-methyltransferase